MDANYLNDRIAWANNQVARRIGTQMDAYRPAGCDDPLAPRNRFLRLPVAFTASPGNFNQTNGYGSATCYAHFDSAYTQPGDYLVAPDHIVFVAAQESLQPVLCVRTNRVLTILRPAAPNAIGSNSYGGLVPVNSTPVIRNWPASVLGMATAGMPLTGLPLDVTLPQWTVLLPNSGGIAPAPSDLVQDDRGMRAVIVSAEISALGWRMIIRQASP